LYCRRAATIFPVSQFVLDENRKYLGLPLRNAVVTHYAPHDHMGVIRDSAALEETRQKYRLPPRFVLGVTRVLHTGNDKPTWFPGKNVETTLRAFALVRDRIPHRLVIAGDGVESYLRSTGWNKDDLEGITFTGFVPHNEIARLYNLADIFVLPSLYEGCPFPLLEAMACGCAVIASHLPVCAELT